MQAGGEEPPLVPNGGQDKGDTSGKEKEVATPTSPKTPERREGTSEWRSTVADLANSSAFNPDSPKVGARVVGESGEEGKRERNNTASRLRGEGVAVDTSSSPLLAAVWEGKLDQVRELVQKEDVNARDGNIDRPAIALAAQWEGIGVKMMELLLENGADVSAVDSRNCTALNIAAEAGLTENVEWLVDHGANLNWRNSKRQTPLYAAASKNRLAVVQVLLDRGALPDMETQEGATPLFIASQNGFADVVKLLYKFKADILHAKEGGATPLFIACQMGHFRVVKFLTKKLKNASNQIDAMTDKGLTPLMVAVQLGYVEIARLLLQRGADVEKCWKGRNALALARDRGQKDIVQLLTVEPRDGWDPDEAALKCAACSAAFNVARRRHHCRSCKHVFCGGCTSKRVRIPALCWLGELRVCDVCFNTIKK